MEINVSSRNDSQMKMSHQRTTGAGRRENCDWKQIVIGGKSAQLLNGVANATQTTHEVYGNFSCGQRRRLMSNFLASLWWLGFCGCCLSLLLAFPPATNLLWWFPIREPTERKHIKLSVSHCNAHELLHVAWPEPDQSLSPSAQNKFVTYQPINQSYHKKSIVGSFHLLFWPRRVERGLTSKPSSSFFAWRISPFTTFVWLLIQFTPMLDSQPFAQLEVKSFRSLFFVCQKCFEEIMNQKKFCVIQLHAPEEVIYFCWSLRNFTS